MGGHGQPAASMPGLSVAVMPQQGLGYNAGMFPIDASLMHASAAHGFGGYLPQPQQQQTAPSQPQLQAVYMHSPYQPQQQPLQPPQQMIFPANAGVPTGA